jgi:hypothetical protein
VEGYVYIMNMKNAKGDVVAYLRHHFGPFLYIARVNIAGNKIFEPAIIENSSEDLPPHRPIKIDCTCVIKYYETKNSYT